MYIYWFLFFYLVYFGIPWYSMPPNLPFSDTNRCFFFRRFGAALQQVMLSALRRSCSQWDGADNKHMLGIIPIETVHMVHTLLETNSSPVRP